jgi:16S rRNA (uracil1498-N3)-methyltransferase
LDGCGRECPAEITEIGKQKVAGKILKCDNLPEKIIRRVTLCAAILKKDNFEWILQKCTELGVAVFRPIITERTIKIKNEVPGRWRDIVREAAEQSERIFLPEIKNPASLKTALKEAAGEKYLAFERGGTLFSKEKLSGEITIFIGPEGGFTEREVALAKESGAKIVSLGQTILRAETASVAATTIAIL